MTSYRQNFYCSGKRSSSAFIWGITRYGSCKVKIWPCGQKFMTLGDLWGVKADRHQKLISWAPDHKLHSHQVWSRSDKSYSKNKGFVNPLKWPQNDLDLWPWPWYRGQKMCNRDLLLMVIYRWDFKLKWVIASEKIGKNQMFTHNKQTKQKKNKKKNLQTDRPTYLAFGEITIHTSKLIESLQNFVCGILRARPTEMNQIRACGPNRLRLGEKRPIWAYGLLWLRYRLKTNSIV